LLFRNLKLPKGVSLHTLRHTHGSHLLAAGVPLTDVSKRLGHVNPHVTATVYAHALPGRDDLAAAAWEKFQKETKPQRTRQIGRSHRKQ
jgi:integrase